MRRILGILLLLTAVPSAALAEFALEAGLTVVGQELSRDNSRINRDLTGSVDLIMDADIGPGVLHLYGEGSTSDRASDVSANTLVPGANNDVGTALDRNNKGRFQLSEFSYAVDIDRLKVSLGVHFLQLFADATAVSNDETTQFLAAPLVNNTAIPFPDYAASAVFRYDGGEDGPGGTLLAANAYGMADNPDRSYGELFRFGNVKGTNLRKGVFVLGELRIPTTVDVTLGGWLRTSELPLNTGVGTKKSAAGVYLDLDGELDDGTTWSMRGGWNSAKDTDVVIAHASLAGEHAYSDGHAIGLGLAWNGLSPSFRATLAHPGNPVMIELYYRWQINKYIGISPDIQYWKNANNVSQAPTGGFGGNVWVYGLRLQIGVSHRIAHE